MSKIIYKCTSCNETTGKWSGKCDACGAWNTLIEDVGLSVGPKGKTLGMQRGKLIPLNPIDTAQIPPKRILSKIGELDRVLGGGLVQASAILVGGDPGIGKSTLLLQAAAKFSQNGLKTIYISGEEAENQIRMRAQRLHLNNQTLKLGTETNLRNILTTLEEEKPDLAIIDSIQTLWADNIDSAPGSVAQVRAACHELVIFAKKNNVAIVLVGHVTKDGQIAGPRVVEHMVDTVLYLEGDDRYEHRILRSAKNRFGATNEVGIFHMNENGLNEVSNPSEMFLSERSKNIPGTCIYPSLEGTRPILIEVQALVSTANFGTPQRNVNGFDLRRLSMLLAVLEKRMELVMGIKDVFINLVGGLKVDDQAADLSILCAIASSFMDKSIDETIVFVGEIGLAGEIRSISRLGHRLAEVSALGFSGAVVPSASMNGKLEKHNLKIYPVDTVRQAFDILF